MKKINKRKKYVGGGMTPYMRTDFNSQLPTQLTALQSVQAYAPGNAKPTSSANFLQSSNFANMFGGSGRSGGGGMAGIGQAGDAINSMISNVTGPATASTVSESRMQTAMGTISGTAKGATAGFAVGGPVGAIVGGVAGLASGIIGKKGSVSVSKNPYDDTVDIKYGTGIRGGARNRRKLRRQAEQAQANARSNQASLQMGSINEQEFYDDYDNDIQTMAQGGMTSSLAYVDDGELLNTPQGVIAEVPEEGKPTDSNLVDLPEGTRILSDKRKVPGSKETFAQMGKRLMSKKKTNRTDKYAENAAMLNEMNDQMIYDKLFAIQEGMKKKQPIQKFQDGGTKRGFRYKEEQTGKEHFYEIGETLPYKGNKFKVIDRNTAVPVRDYSSFNTNMSADRVLTPQYQLSSIDINLPQVDVSNRFKRKVTPTTVNNINNSLDLSGETVSRPNSEVIPTRSVQRTAPKQRIISAYTVDPVENALDISGETQARVGDEVAPYITSTGSTEEKPATSTTGKNNWLSGVGNLFTDIAALAPTISNMYTKPESFNAVYNPYEAQINQTMANRRFDISPAKRAIRENRAISNYNAANYNPNTGANLAYRIQSQVAANKAISDLYSTASNVNNQYKADYASTLNSLGQQRVNATNMAVDMNARSRAAARNIQRTALSQLSQYAQNKQLMKNQKSRDMAMLEMYGPFLEAGYKASDYASFMKQFKKG